MALLVDLPVMVFRCFPSFVGFSISFCVFVIVIADCRQIKIKKICPILAIYFTSLVRGRWGGHVRTKKLFVVIAFLFKVNEQRTLDVQNRTLL